MEINLSRFNESISNFALETKEADKIQRAMDVLYFVIYSGMASIGSADFKVFDLDDGEYAYKELFNYHPDDIVDSEEEEEDNRKNLLVEINRVSHAAICVERLSDEKKIRRFI